ncbi:acyl-CoA synthetase family member 2, mitochondrial [Diachasma alloeum]|uniref:acyl-CoA synthetase family member 2, mitochondrial n=1 Tax=Diachasma alloeum TaxID=454923 RepID=UPI0007382A41|nr:acyl-CoA synthetase family member 2, mitochondrial [Diachasma alloeum]
MKMLSVRRQIARYFFSENTLSRNFGRGNFVSQADKPTYDDSAASRTSPSQSDNLSHKYNPGAVPLVDMTVGQLVERAARLWPNREAFVSIPQGIRITYKQALERGDKIAAGLKKLGLKPRDRVGIWGPNDVEWSLAFLGITRAGLVAVGINPAYRQAEIDYCIEKVGVSAVVAPAKFKTQDYGAMLENTRSKGGLFRHIILWSREHRTGAHRLVDVESLGGKVEVEAIRHTQGEISAHDGCNIQFTSGTTGQPKAPFISHRSIVNNGIQVAEREGLPRDHHRICLNVPFFHAFGMVQGLMAMFHSGSTLVIESQTFNPRASIEAIAREKCTGAFGTPTMWVNMMSIQSQLKAPVDELKWVVTGGANASPEMIKNVVITFGLENFRMIYGLTETTAVMFSTNPGEPEELTHSTVGCLQHHLEVKVVDERGALVPFGTPGELLMRGYSAMMGYWGDPEGTSKTIDGDGWLRTGDKFVLREDGYGHIVGRIKDMVIRGGENIYPKEIECFLETHPEILEAQIFGVPDQVYGEELCACIRLKKGANLSPEEVRSFSKGNIAHFKIPRYILTVEEFPKTASGKIQKLKLREEMERKKLIPVTNT